MSKVNITIIGCGWLGKKLAEVLISDGHKVYGSTTSPERIPELEAVTIDVFVMDNVNPVIPEEVISNTDVAIITVPPFNRDQPKAYGEYLDKISEQFSDEVIRVFTSSTGVYPKEAGEYDETYSFSAEEKNALYWAEEVIRKSEKHLILRLGGLFGSDRHPIHSIVKRGTVSNPDGVINFVHRMDVIRFIQHQIENETQFGTFNLVYPDYPKRIDYYSNCAQHFGYETPTAESSKTTIRKISSKKAQLIARFSFNYNLTELD